MDEGETEACGRCSMTAVVDAVDADRDPFGDERIEVDESEMRAAARPQVFAGRVKDRLDAWASRFVYGR